MAKRGAPPTDDRNGKGTSSVEYEAHLTSTIPAVSTLEQPCVNYDMDVLDENPILNKFDDEGLAYVRPTGTFAKQTHVVCTLGPSSRSVEMVEKLLMAGMSVARFNFSHGSHEYHQETLDNLRAATKNTGLMCAVLLDTKGPEIRTGELVDGKPVTYQEGSTVKVTSNYATKGDQGTIAISYAKFARVVRPGNIILVADGSLMLRVTDVNSDQGYAKAICLNTATIGERKNCNLPGVNVDLPILTKKDEQDLIEFGVKNQVDFVAASFVRSASDVKIIRHVLGEEGKFIRIISKIENQEGLRNLDEVVEESDGIMIARGDLGMEIPLEKMFHVQKMMIQKCNLAGKPVVTATQMLESMVNNPRPTRAEATDVANAVLDGTDCVMLSGETAAGKFPIEAVKVMQSICTEAEKCIDNYEVCQSLLRTTMARGNLSVIESLASSAVSTASKVGAKLIVALAANGNAARLLSKYRPCVPVVVGVVPREGRSAIGFSERDASGHMVARQCLLTRGLIPYITSPKDPKQHPAGAAQQCVEEALEFAKLKGLVRSGDLVVTMHNVDKRCAAVKVVPCP